MRFPLPVLPVPGLVPILLMLTACGPAREAAPSDDNAGVTGTVLLGPQCPVETAGEPCDDAPASLVEVTVSEQLPGEAHAAGAEVAHGTTDDAGRFQVSVAPGEYVLTAAAGMSCELMDVRVEPGEWARVDVPCDTGIR